MNLVLFHCSDVFAAFWLFMCLLDSKKDVMKEKIAKEENSSLYGLVWTAQSLLYLPAF